MYIPTLRVRYTSLHVLCSVNI